MWNLMGQNKEEEPLQIKTPAGGEKEGPVNKTYPEASRPRSTAILGASTLIKGELTGNEDLTIDGRVEGRIDLKQHRLTIGPGGKITADIQAKYVTIQGEVQGNITAQEMVEIQPGGKLRGDIITPRVSIMDGAFFKGSVEMEKTAAAPKTDTQAKAPQTPSQAEPALARASKG